MEPQEPLYWLLREVETDLLNLSRDLSAYRRDWLEADCYPELAGALVEEYAQRIVDCEVTLGGRAFCFALWYTHVILRLRLQSFRTQRRILGFLKQYTTLPLIPTTTAY